MHIARLVWSSRHCRELSLHIALQRLEALLPDSLVPDRRLLALRVQVAPVDLRQYDALLSLDLPVTEAAG